MAIGAFILGIMAKSFGYRSVFISGIVLIIGGGFAYFALARRKKNGGCYVAEGSKVGETTKNSRLALGRKEVRHLSPS